MTDRQKCNSSLTLTTCCFHINSSSTNNNNDDDDSLGVPGPPSLLPAPTAKMALRFSVLWLRGDKRKDEEEGDGEGDLLSLSLLLHVRSIPASICDARSLSVPCWSPLPLCVWEAEILCVGEVLFFPPPPPPPVPKACSSAAAAAAAAAPCSFFPNFLRTFLLYSFFFSAARLFPKLVQPLLQS